LLQEFVDDLLPFFTVNPGLSSTTVAEALNPSSCPQA